MKAKLINESQDLSAKPYLNGYLKGWIKINNEEYKHAESGWVVTTYYDYNGDKKWEILDDERMGVTGDFEETLSAAIGCANEIIHEEQHPETSFNPILRALSQDKYSEYYKHSTNESQDLSDKSYLKGWTKIGEDYWEHAESGYAVERLSPHFADNNENAWQILKDGYDEYGEYIITVKQAIKVANQCMKNDKWHNEQENKRSKSIDKKLDQFWSKKFGATGGFIDGNLADDSNIEYIYIDVRSFKRKIYSDFFDGNYTQYLDMIKDAYSEYGKVLSVKYQKKYDRITIIVNPKFIV